MKRCKKKEESKGISDISFVYKEGSQEETFNNGVQMKIHLVLTGLLNYFC